MLMIFFFEKKLSKRGKNSYPNVQNVFFIQLFEKGITIGFFALKLCCQPARFSVHGGSGGAVASEACRQMAVLGKSFFCVVR